MKSTLFFLGILLFLTACEEEEKPAFLLLEATIGSLEVPLDGTNLDQVPLDRIISLRFSENIDPASLSNSIKLTAGGNTLPINLNLASAQTIAVQAIGGLQSGQTHQLEILNSLKSANKTSFLGKTLSFSTQKGALSVESVTFSGGETLPNGRIQNVNLNFEAQFRFNFPLNPNNIQSSIQLTGAETSALTFELGEDPRTLKIRSSSPLKDLSKYRITLTQALTGANGETFSDWNREFYTSAAPNPKFPLISEEALLTKVQEHTFRYFWDFGHPISGMARERNTSLNTVTTGGSGFGLMAMIVGVERGFISRAQALERWSKIISFLKNADRFHGVWPHWLNGETGKTIPFSAKDNGGDLVETAFLIQGLLTVQAYLDPQVPTEKSLIDQITILWEEVEWDWYTKNNSGVLYWHWSPNFGWEMNLPIRGYNESLIVYVLATSSPTHQTSKSTYEQGWAINGAIKNGKSFYGKTLPLGIDFGGPLFFSHYSFLGLDPRKLQDQYANYWEQNVKHSQINQAHAIANPKSFVGYSAENWGFTASDNHIGYNAHSPTDDLGVITPTAALSSFPYTPEESMKALQFFYYALGDRTWGEYGFYDAFNITESWYAKSYLAIDQGPIIVMLENHRSGLLWNLFMKNHTILNGLEKLGFSYK
ncbi:glucoamylase family protein [Algoriphagus mannitolivorans]|uniref:glucoamylase family protein n=1 Tax=Algoriphagus mannitolivorans TaxID=226504 RepID=UPI00047A083E|nr:glucoamylase family protein [Algoriphagus mannitolivorans]